jgi:hypothetical protein
MLKGEYLLIEDTIIPGSIYQFSDKYLGWFVTRNLSRGDRALRKIILHL